MYMSIILCIRTLAFFLLHLLFVQPCFFIFLPFLEEEDERVWERVKRESRGPLQEPGGPGGGTPLGINI